MEGRRWEREYVNESSYVYKERKERIGEQRHG